MVQFCARPTMENGSQCVGMKECKTDTVAMPPIVETSFAISAIIFFPSKKNKIACVSSFNPVVDLARLACLWVQNHYQVMLAATHDVQTQLQ